LSQEYLKNCIQDVSTSNNILLHAISAALKFALRQDTCLVAHLIILLVHYPYDANHGVWNCAIHKFDEADFMIFSHDISDSSKGYVTQV
jgi:hypothetical protein